MPIYKVRDPQSGKTLKLQGDSPPTEQELEQMFSQFQGGTDISQARDVTDPSMGIKQGRLTAQERLSGGFYGHAPLAERRAQQAQQLGLQPGTALEPTGFNLENLKDLPMDFLDAVGPMFPSIGQIIGSVIGGASGLAAGGAPAAAGVVAGGIAGASIWEGMRQAIGQMLGYDQGTVGERITNLAVETGAAAFGEGLGLAYAATLRATKIGVIKGANKAISKEGVDKFNRWFGVLATRMNHKKIIAAQGYLKSGKREILRGSFAKPETLDSFALRFLFGRRLRDGRGIAGHIQKLINDTNPAGRESVKTFLTRTLGLSDDVLETISRKGANVMKYADDDAVFKLGREIVDTVFGKPSDPDKLGIIDQVGRRLAAEREELAKAAPGAKINLTEINEGFARDGVRANVLRPVKEIIDGEDVVGYEINKSFARTRTGRNISQTYQNILDDFFTKKEVSKGASDDIIREAIRQGAPEEEVLRLSRGTSRKLYLPGNEIKYSGKGGFIKKFNQWDAQLTARDFDNMANLSPALAVYKRGLSDHILATADQAGLPGVRQYTEEYVKLKTVFSSLKRSLQSNDLAGVEAMLVGLSRDKALSANLLTARQMSAVLKPKGIDLFDVLDTHKASASLKPFAKSELARSEAIKPLRATMKSAYGGGGQTDILRDIGRYIDPHLPKWQRPIQEFAQLHSIASDLHETSMSLLRGRFLASALGIQGIAGGLYALTGQRLDPRLSGTVALVVGLALQNPKLYRRLLVTAYKMKPGQKAIPVPSRLVNVMAPKARGTAVAGAEAGSHLIRALLRKQRASRREK